VSARPVALVTGAAGAIGRETAIEFARRGYDLEVIDLDAGQLRPVVEEATAAGASVAATAIDLADLAATDVALATIAARRPTLDVLVNNAAWRRVQTMREATIDDWERTIRVCLTAPAFLARWAAELMRPRRRGVIINVTTMNAVRTGGVCAAYVAAKGGLISLTYELASLYGCAGIRVVAVSPGAVDTALSGDWTGERDLASDLRRASEDAIPLGRWATSAEVARAIAMLCGPDASYVTGTVVTVDGGYEHALIPASLQRRLSASFA
jgi:NAD(P)-dependent dehydrogenase (short-subunit alcohol dehydrogenase family)